MDKHKQNFAKLVEYTGKHSKEDKQEAQFGCLLVDTKGNEFFAVTTYECAKEEMKDRTLKYTGCDYSVKNAGKKWVESGRENEIEYAYCIPCFPCGVDQVFLNAFKVQTLVVPKAHPEIRERWTNFSVSKLFDTFVHKNPNMMFIYYNQEIY